MDSLDSVAKRLYERNFGRARMADREVIAALLLDAAARAAGKPFSPRFLLSEWEQVVDAWQLETWESYRDVARLGRKTRLPEPQRAAAVVDLCAGADGVGSAGRDYAGRRIRPLGREVRQWRARAVRLHRRRRGAGYRGGATALFSRAGRWSQARAVFRGRSGAAHFPAAVLLEGGGRRCARSVVHAEGQLSHVASDPHPGGPAAGAGSDRRRWQ